MAGRWGDKAGPCQESEVKGRECKQGWGGEREISDGEDKLYVLQYHGQGPC